MSDPPPANYKEITNPKRDPPDYQIEREDKSCPKSPPRFDPLFGKNESQASTNSPSKGLPTHYWSSSPNKHVHSHPLLTLLLQPHSPSNPPPLPHTDAPTLPERNAINQSIKENPTDICPHEQILSKSVTNVSERRTRRFVHKHSFHRAIRKQWT